MADPFVKRDLYDTYAYIGRETFVSLMQKLEQIGFTQQTIVLPADSGSNLKKDTTAPATSKILSVSQFLDLDQDFAGIVVRAENDSSREEVVILFRNNSEKVLGFTDNIFPHVQGELSSNFYVSTQDPVRTYGLVVYLKDFFKNEIQNQGLRQLLIAIISIVAFFGLYIYLTDKLGNRNLSGLLGVGLLVLVVLVTSRYFPQKGLKVSSAKVLRNYPPYIEKLRESWLLIIVTAAISVTATLSTQYISYFVGLK